MSAMLLSVMAPWSFGAQDGPDVSALGPQAGERAPGFSLTDQTGTTRSLESILGPNGALLVFFRSADW